jgi:hypothetical protein
MAFKRPKGTILQIIIVQAEIEQAIRNHILSQINVKDNHDILIDLSATRGADGFKATIDIVPSNTTAAKPAVQQQQQPQPEPKAESVATKPAKQEAAPSQAKQEQPPVDNAHVAEGAEQFPEASTDGAAVEAGPATDASAEAEPAGEQPAGTAEDAPKGRTLFPNLKRVSNS